MKPTKAELSVLEKAFSREIAYTLSEQDTPLVQLGNNKAVRSCVEKGWLQEADHTLGGRFPLKIKGYVLTLSGNMAYCVNVPSDPSDSEV